MGYRLLTHAFIALLVPPLGICPMGRPDPLAAPKELADAV